MAVYRFPDAIRNYVGVAADGFPDVADMPLAERIGSRYLRADTSTEYLYIGEYYATSVLTVSDQPEASDTIDIGCTQYTFIAACPGAACDGEIDLGSTIAEAVANIVAAINGTDGINTANPDVTAEATAAGEVTITSIETGTAANSTSTVYTVDDCCSCSMNAFGAATLAGGQDEWTALP